MNHKQLVEKAKFWLIHAKGCNPVFTEKGSSGFSEIPDAIGWTSEKCIVVECKTSIQDLKADFIKPHRNEENQLGDERYYLLSQEILEEAKIILDTSMWGILSHNSCEVIKQLRFEGSAKFKSCKIKEISFLRSRILQIQRFGH